MTHHHTDKATAARRVGRLVPMVAALLLLATLAVVIFSFIIGAWEDGEPGRPGQPPLAESPRLHSEDPANAPAPE